MYKKIFLLAVCNKTKKIESHSAAVENISPQPHTDDVIWFWLLRHPLECRLPLSPIIREFYGEFNALSDGDSVFKDLENTWK